MSAELRTRSTFCANAASGFVALFNRILQSLKSASAFSDRYRDRELIVVSVEAPVSEPSVNDREERLMMAIAIACASISFRGAAMDAEGMLSLADEYRDYIFGKTDNPPRADLTGTVKGKRK